MSIVELQQQLETVRQQAFANGYAAAMKEVREHARRATSGSDKGAALSLSGRGGARTRARTRQTAPRLRTPRRGSPPRTAATRAATARRAVTRRSRRGTNAVLVMEVLKAAAPRALRQAEIRKALQAKGKVMSFPSIGYSLRQLAARDAAKRGGDGKTWRHSRP